MLSALLKRAFMNFTSGGEDEANVIVDSLDLHHHEITNERVPGTVPQAP